MNNNLETVNIVYENSSNANQSEYARRVRSLTRSKAQRNVRKPSNNKAVRRFSLGNKGNVKNAGINASRHQAVVTHAQAPLKVLKTRRRR